jgi:signal peptidase II
LTPRNRYQMNITKRLLLLMFVVVACVGCDQTTKVYAERSLPKSHAIRFLGDTVRLQVVHNDGAFLSLGAAAPGSWRFAVLRFEVSAILIAVFVYALWIPKPHWSEMAALALILAGGVSNLIDRYVHDGYVIDFINLGLGLLRTGIFNVADVALMVGVIMLFVQGLRSRRSRPSSNRSP